MHQNQPTPDLSIIIPARNEIFLGRTVQDLLEHIEGNTDIIVVLDGYLPDPPLPADRRVTIIYNPEAVGQRAATNDAVNLSRAKYVMKVDAHCAFDQGFDVKMMADMQEDWTMVPKMKNLHIFDWVCPDGHRRYQGRNEKLLCVTCGKPVTMDIVWEPKSSPNSVGYRFDYENFHFQYWNEIGYGRGDLTETMSIQGSCFMVTKAKYLELDLCSEEFHSWGQQGVEVSCKTWLSGGKVIVNHKTWYAHMFRTQGGNFGFPYSNPQSKINENRRISRELFMGDKWPKAIHKFQWLIEKFHPPGWPTDTPSKGIIFYTDNDLDEKVAKPVRERLIQVYKDTGIPIVSSSLKSMDLGIKNIHFPSLKRGYLTMFKQILSALENIKTDIVFFCEHDVLYSNSHFDFTPTDKETFYYNENVWFLRLTDGHALHYDVKQLSGLCVYRQAALTHFRERYMLVEEYVNTHPQDTDEAAHEFNAFIRNIGFEPMTHGRIPWKSVFPCSAWKSEVPNVDIKHGANLTGQRWKKEQYRNQRLLVNWTESDTEIPSWGATQSLISLLS